MYAGPDKGVDEGLDDLAGDAQPFLQLLGVGRIPPGHPAEKFGAVPAVLGGGVDLVHKAVFFAVPLRRPVGDLLQKAPRKLFGLFCLGKALFQGPDEGALVKGPDRAVSSPSFAEGLFGCPKAGKRSPGKRRRGRTGEKAEVRRKNHKNFLFFPFKHLTRKRVFGIIERLYGRSVCKFCPPAG